MVNKGLISLIKNIINGRLSFQILFPFCGTSFQCRKKWLVHTWRTFHRSNTGDELLACLLRMGQTEEKRGLTRLPNFLCVANIYHIISHHITSSVFFLAILQAPAVDESAGQERHGKADDRVPSAWEIAAVEGWPTSTLRRGYRLPKWTDIHH